MSGLISSLAGAPGAASQAGSYYQQAMQNLINAYGSPAAQTFGKEEQQSLQPMFAQQTQGLVDQLNALGIQNSGAGSAQLGNLAANQSSTLAGAIAPLYSQALSQYGNIDAMMPGAQNQAYQNAISNFYGALSGTAGLVGDAFGVPGMGSFSTNASGQGFVDNMGNPTTANDPYAGYADLGTGGNQGNPGGMYDTPPVYQGSTPAYVGVPGTSNASTDNPYG